MLKEFLDKYGTNTTSNFQLLHWGKQLKIPNFQVLMKDEIKDAKLKLPINIITNNNTSKQVGSHWSCFHMRNNGEKIWFDSYGSPPLIEIIEKFQGETSSHRKRSPILANTTKYQDFNTSYCGQLSLYFLYIIQNNNLNDVLLSLRG